MKASTVAAALALSLIMGADCFPLLGGNVRANAGIRANSTLSTNTLVGKTQADLKANVKTGAQVAANVKAKIDTANKVHADAHLNVGHATEGKVNGNIHAAADNKATIDANVKATLPPIQAKANVNLGNVANVGLNANVGSTNGNGNILNADAKAKVAGLDAGAKVKLGGNGADVKATLHNSIPSEAKKQADKSQGASPLVSLDLGKPDPNSGINIANIAHIGLGGGDNDSTRGHASGPDNTHVGAEAGNDSKGFKGNAAARPGNGPHSDNAGASNAASVGSNIGLPGLDIGAAANLGGADGSSDGNANGSGHTIKLGKPGHAGSDGGITASIGTNVGANKEHTTKSGGQSQSDGANVTGDINVPGLAEIHAGVGVGGSNKGATSTNRGHNKSDQSHKPEHDQDDHNGGSKKQPGGGQHPSEPNFPNNPNQLKKSKGHCATGFALDPITGSCERDNSHGRQQKTPCVQPNSAGKCPIDHKKHPFLNLCFDVGIDLDHELSVSGPHHAVATAGGCQGGHVLHPYLDEICIDSRIQFGLDVAHQDSRPDIYGSCASGYRHHSSILDLCIATSLDVDLGNSRLGRLIADDDICRAGWRNHPDVAHLCVDSALNIGLFDSDRPSNGDGSCSSGYVHHPLVAQLCITESISATIHGASQPHTSQGQKSIPAKQPAKKQAGGGITVDQEANIAASVAGIGANIHDTISLGL